jgi:hypothetical protein
MQTVPDAMGSGGWRTEGSITLVSGNISCPLTALFAPEYFGTLPDRLKALWSWPMSFELLLRKNEMRKEAAKHSVSGAWKTF